MTPTQRAALEQVAREAILKINEISPQQWDSYDQRDYEYLLGILAAQRAAVLEEVANEMARHPYWSKEADVWIKHLRQLAQEQRP